MSRSRTPWPLPETHSAARRKGVLGIPRQHPEESPPGPPPAAPVPDTTPGHALSHASAGTSLAIALHPFIWVIFLHSPCHPFSCGVTRIYCLVLALKCKQHGDGDPVSRTTTSLVPAPIPGTQGHRMRPWASFLLSACLSHLSCEMGVEVED